MPYPNHDFNTMERNRQKMWLFPTDPHQSERDACAILRRHMIYAVPGRWSEWKYTDVVAFGCVTIETKISTLKSHAGNDTFHWRIASKNHDSGMRGQIMMLMCDYGNKVDVALFPADHEVFYTHEGELKKGMSWRPNAKTTWHTNRYGVGMTDEIWQKHRGNWKLVWQVLGQNTHSLYVNATE